MKAGRLRRTWSWLWRPRAHASQANGECPICGRAVVVAGTIMMGNPYSGPMMAPRTREEVVAACPDHGHPPYNDASRARDQGSG